MVTAAPIGKTSESRHSHERTKYASYSSLAALPPINWSTSAQPIRSRPRITLSARYGYKYLNDKDGNYGVPGDPYVVYQTASAAAGLPVPTVGGTGIFKRQQHANHLSRRDHPEQPLCGWLLSGKFVGPTSISLWAGYSLNRLTNDVATDYTNGDFNLFWGQSYSRGQYRQPKTGR